MIPAPCGTAKHPMRTMACLFLFYCILNFCMPFCVLGRLCRNIGIKEMCLYCGTNGKAQKAMERAQARSNILLRKKSILLTPRPWWRQCPRRFRRRWQAAHRRSPPGPWPPPASELRRRQRFSPWGYPGRSCS